MCVGFCCVSLKIKLAQTHDPPAITQATHVVSTTPYLPLMYTHAAFAMRRVLSRPAANRQQPVAARPTTAAAAAASAAPDSRPSTAASLLSLKQQHQLQWQSDAAAGFSRPGATGGSSRLGTPSSGANRPHATTPPAASVAHSNGSDAGALSNIGTAFNRTLLLEMVQLDDVSLIGEGERTCGICVWVAQS